MHTLLHLDSSGKGNTSVTHGLTKYFAEQWQLDHDRGKVVYRDLLAGPVPFVTEQTVNALFTPEEALSAGQKALLKESDEFIAELHDADTYIMGIPMYNFGVPAVFKAYIDLIARSGKTFTFAGGAPKGLLANKKLIVVTSSGGDYSAEPMKGMDFVQPYLRAVFAFLGVTDVTFFSAPGHNEAEVAASVERAKRQIDALFQTVPAR